MRGWEAGFPRLREPGELGSTKRRGPLGKGVAGTVAPSAKRGSQAAHF